MFQDAHWFIFVMAIALFVMIMTNFIMNVAAIAISIPVALVIAPYGIPASLLLMLVTGLAVMVIWPLLGMPILVT